ncbi:MAG: right-handed parallel beta-helix repeat-containing protein [Chitinophagales bacterium]|nr:right-handed parallel beta-helix repeat-containing protein [Chitinophagales bacterium]
MDGYDISRISNESTEQHYVGVLMQQGRVHLESDGNAAQNIQQAEEQETRIDVIGPYGSPDKGFYIHNLRTDDGVIDFDIHYGTMYLGGLRLIMAPDDEAYRLQKDWLQQPQEGHMPVPALEEGQERFDLVYLEAWQQAVSAIEDAELFEPALGGPDTTTRIRNMRHVKIQPDIGYEECEPAWQAYRQKLQDNQLGTIDADYELIPDTRLLVDYIEIDDPEDLCSPDAVNGYLGAENQAIRVQLRGENNFIWGLDNAAPLYRVQVTGDQVYFLTEPKDQHHWPLAGQIVEILPWQAVLANGEKVAALSGHLSRVNESYDPDASTLKLNGMLPADFGMDWKDRSDSTALENQDPSEYYYLRVWQGIPDDEPILKSYTPGIPVVLGNTGIRVTIFGDDHQPNDYWVIGTRPETPDQALPWSLENPGGVVPHGVRQYRAPLAIVRWYWEDQEVKGRIIRDCRKTFRPLTDLESCCTFHVGDGITSFGDFDSIEEALLNLPASGGEICVLPGQHEANFSIRNRQNIKISGCGVRSIISPRKDNVSAPIASLHNVQNITIESLKFVQPGGTAIRLFDRVNMAPSSKITIENNEIFASEYAIFIEVDDVAQGENHIYIIDNQIAQLDNENGKNGIFCLADEVLIKGNKLVVVPAPAPEDPEDPRDEEEPPGGIFDPCSDPVGFLNNRFFLRNYTFSLFKYITRLQRVSTKVSFQTWGGVQIGGGSESVKIIDNKIIGGRGHGITLGHLPTYGRVKDDDNGDDGIVLKDEYDKARSNVARNGYYITEDYTNGFRNSMARRFNSYIYNISIEENLIRNSGLSGIGTLAYFDIAGKREGLFISIQDLTIYRNHITECCRQIPEEIGGDLRQEIGFGGIAITSCELARIEENRIENNGLSFIDPICGIFFYQAEDIEISRNRILNNGPRRAIDLDSIGVSNQARNGNRGGIFIRSTIKTNLGEILLGELFSDGIPASKIHDNIVLQPLGQSLYQVAMGPVSVVGNQFTSNAIDFGNPTSLISGAVFILNTGVSKDMLRFLVEPPLRKLACVSIQEETDETAIAIVQLLLLILQYLPSGNTLVANNQIVLDLRNLALDISLSAIACISLDDIGFVSNQVECKGLAFFNPNAESPRTTPFIPIDILLFGTALIGYTVRASDNRFQEGFSFVPVSLLSVGFYSTVLGNQASNCIFAYGYGTIERNNFEQMLRPFIPGISEKLCAPSKNEFGQEAGIECLKGEEEDPNSNPNPGSNIPVGFVSDNAIMGLI